jgi:hypothetical protein
MVLVVVVDMMIALMVTVAVVAFLTMVRMVVEVRGW